MNTSNPPSNDKLYTAKTLFVIRIVQANTFNPFAIVTRIVQKRLAKADDEIAPDRHREYLALWHEMELDIIKSLDLEV